MGLAKGVSGKARDQPPHFLNLRFVMPAPSRRCKEFLLNLRNDATFLFVQRAAQHVGASGIQSGEGFTDLQDVFLIHDQPESVAQHGFK